MLKIPPLLQPFSSWACALIVTATCGVAADWPQWRGVDRKDHSPDPAILAPWPKEGPKQKWLYKNAGLGYAGFSVAGGKLFTMGARTDTKSEHAICLNAETGEELWTTSLGPIYENRWGNGPRSTPTVDGDKVYVLTGTGVLACLEVATGKVVWKIDMVKDLGGELQSWGYTESVLIDGDALICTPGGKQGTMAALDKKTGKVLWRSKGLTAAAQYASPIIVTGAGPKQYVQQLMGKVVGVAADDGRLLWETDFPSRVAVIPTPIYDQGHVYITAGYGAGCQMIKLGEKEPEVVYEERRITNHHGGVVLVDGKLYGHSDRGGWTCQDFLTGEIDWQYDGLGKGCLTWVAGHLICVDENDGTVVLAKADPKGWNEVSRFKLSPQTKLRAPDGRIWVHPVVVNGNLYLRDQELVFCYDVKPK